MTIENHHESEEWPPRWYPKRNYGYLTSTTNRPPMVFRKSMGALRFPPVDIRSWEGGGKLAVGETPLRGLKLYYLRPEPYRPIGLSSALWEVAYYLREEQDYDFIPYGADDEAWFWAEEDYRGGHIAGAALFHRWEPDEENSFTTTELAWVWIHPFRRHQGLLKSAWPLWENAYGKKVWIQAPWSNAMFEFAKSINHWQYQLWKEKRENEG